MTVQNLSISRPNVSRHSIVYHCLTPDPVQALFMGNGPTGATVHTPDDSLYLLISRADIWNERQAMGAIAAVRLRGTAGLFTTSQPVRQECRMDEAAITLQLGTPSGTVEIHLTCLRGQDLIVIDINDQRQQKDGWSLTLENWHEDDDSWCLENSILETTHVNRSSCFEEINRMVGVNAEEIGVRDPILGRAWGMWARAEEGSAQENSIHIPAGEKRRVIIATACQANEGSGADFEACLHNVREAGKTLVETGAPQLAAAMEAHAEWWRSFWDRSFIQLSSVDGQAEYHERLWYVNMYAHACGMGGAFPMRFNGGPFLFDKNKRSWDWGYWGQNMRLVYFPMLAAGHHEFVREYIDWYLSNESFVAEQTKSMFGVEGLCWRETQTVWGADRGSSLDNPNELMHFHFTNNLECCLLMDAYYRYTDDEHFLREKYFPALAGILAFYRNYATRGEDGKYHITPAAAVEVWPNMVDPQSDICGLRFFLPLAIAWGEELGTDDDTLNGWRDLLENLAPIPVGRWHLAYTYEDGIHDHRTLTRSELREDGIYLPAADQTKPDTVRANMENAELYIVFPWGMVNLDSPREDMRRVENTWSHRTWRYVNNGWCQDTMQMARLGWREEMKTTLAQHAGYTQRFPSGLFISPAPPHFHGLVTDTPYFDSAGVHLSALEEMFLQSYDGVLKLAPAVPHSWSGACRLHSFDGFQVDLTVTKGLPVQARITGLKTSTKLCLKNHRWETMLVEKANGETQRIAGGNLLTTEIASNETIEIRWEGVTVEEQAVEELPDVLWPQFKAMPPLAAYRLGNWHDESQNHGQVGLLEDGLFPATRQSPTSVER